MRKLGQTISALNRYRRHWSTLLQSTGAKGRARHAIHCHASHRTDRLRLQPRRVADVHLRAEKPESRAGAGRRAARLHAIGRQLRHRRGLVHARRSLRLRAAAPRADPGEQSEDLLQLVPARRHRARRRRGAVDPADDREDDRRAWRRPRPRVHHRALGRRRDDGRDAGRLSGGVRRGRDHRGAALRHRRQCAAGVREHVPGTAAQRKGMGRLWCGAPRAIAGRGRAYRSGTAMPTRP